MHTHHQIPGYTTADTDTATANATSAISTTTSHTTSMLLMKNATLGYWYKDKYKENILLRHHLPKHRRLYLAFCDLSR